MQICVEHIESLLVIMVLQNNNIGYKWILEEIFSYLPTWELNKQIAMQFEAIIILDDLWNLS
jgi:hypothetical protein